MLVAGMRVEARAMTDRHGALEDGDVARDPTVDLHQPAAARPPARTVRGPHHARWGALVEEEPGDRHVERAGQCGEGLERGRSLVVLDLAEVPDVETRRLGDGSQRQPAIDPPAADATADERAAALARPLRCSHRYAALCPHTNDID